MAIGIVDWLNGIGLPQYGDAFVGNDIDLDTLPRLTEQDLAQLGVSMGHRKKMLKAIEDGMPEGDTSPPHSTSGVPPESLTSQGERRQLTVLFCDLVGSTALSNTRDPEEYRAILARYHETAISAIQRYDGFVAQIQGDGVVAYFGYPLAHEGEAERAVRAGISVIERLAQLEDGLPELLRVRIGIASGLVVVSHVLAPDKSAVGETPNLAARLQTLAQPGEVMISERTRVLAGGAFDYLDCGVHALKGIGEPTRVWRILGQSDAQSRFDAATRGQLTPMVGRDQEIGLLIDRWELARAGEGQVVLLQGPPGIGKSRMLRAFVERLGAGIEATLTYQCSPFYTNSAFYPLAEHLERTLGFTREDSPEQKLDKLERRFIGELGLARTDCNLLARALSIPCEARYGALEMSPQRQKDETVRVFVDAVARIASAQACALLFEDAHWADPSTLEVLSALVDRGETLPLLVMITYRPEFQPPWLSRAHVTPIALTRLSRAQGASIVLRVAHNKPLPADLVAQIVDKTDGVPLFLEELTKAVLESNMVRELADRYDYSGKLEKLAIPSTLRDSLMARLDRLLPVKEIAQIGAVLGREFSYELVHAISPMGEAQLTEALDKLVGSELVFRRGSPPNATYIFKHALVQDAAYESLLKGKRQALHAQIAQVIEQRLPAKADSEPELIAHHYTEAGMAEAAIPYWQKAGALARQRFALQEAVSSYRMALHLLTGIDSSPSQMVRYVDIAIDWADLIVPGREVIAALEIAEDYARQLQDQIRSVKVASYLGQLLFYLGESDPAATHLKRVIEMGEGVPVKDRLGSAYRCLGQLYLFAYSRCSEALGYIEQAVPIAQATGNRFEESCCHGLLGLEYGYLGRFERSFAAFDTALRAAKASQEYSIECWNLMWRSHILALRGDWADAASAAENGIILARKIGNLWAVDWCMVIGSYSQFVMRRDPDVLSRARKAMEGIGATTCVAVAGAYLAEMYMWSGDASEAAALSDRALAELQYGSYFSADIRIPCLRAQLEAEKPGANWDTVASHMQHALETARSQQRRPDLARCRLRQAELLLRQDAIDAARVNLEEAHRLFAEMGMIWWVREAEKVRAAISK